MSKKSDIAVEIGPPIPLTAREKAVFAPCLKQRGLTMGMLDIMTNIPHRTCIVKARSSRIVFPCCYPIIHGVPTFASLFL